MFVTIRLQATKAGDVRTKNVGDKTNVRTVVAYFTGYIV
jgi:hypothetical protein